MDKPVVVMVESEHGELTPASLECVEEGREVADRPTGSTPRSRPFCAAVGWSRWPRRWRRTARIK